MIFWVGFLFISRMGEEEMGKRSNKVDELGLKPSITNGCMGIAGIAQVANHQQKLLLVEDPPSINRYFPLLYWWGSIPKNSYISNALLDRIKWKQVRRH